MGDCICPDRDCPFHDNRPAPKVHLTPVMSERGFQHLPPVSGTYGDEVTVYESSSAEGPHIWVNVGSPITGVACHTSAHLSLDAAKQLQDQIGWLIEHHYQRTSELRSSDSGSSNDH